jgi:hypothetical protein
MFPSLEVSKSPGGFAGYVLVCGEGFVLGFAMLLVKRVKSGLLFGGWLLDDSTIVSQPLSRLLLA